MGKVRASCTAKAPPRQRRDMRDGFCRRFPALMKLRAMGWRVAWQDRSRVKISLFSNVRSTAMNSPECFYLHLAGAQQGPYTIPQIDHLLNSGLIGIETLYWCEGLDQWQPVTSLVPMRKKPKRWVKPVVVAIVIFTLAVPLRVFGPVLIDGWSEANQHAFTESAAYWRARDVIRGELRARGLLVEFRPFAEARVALQSPAAATVHLRGAIVGTNGRESPVTWNVPMNFDAEAREWSGGPGEEIPAP